MYRTHHGDLSWWHGTYSGEANGQEMVDKIVRWSIQNIALARVSFSRGHVEQAGEELGRFLHTVEDTYAPSHVCRRSSGEIVRFQDYGTQDPALHAKGDLKEYNELRYAQAARAVRRLLRRIIVEQQTVGELETILRNEILVLARDSEGKLAVNMGGTEECYAKHPRIPKPGTIHEIYMRERIDEVEIREKAMRLRGFFLGQQEVSHQVDIESILLDYNAFETIQFIGF